VSSISALWNENIPSDGSIVARGRQDILDMWTALSQGLGESVIFPGGELKEGVSRTYFDVSSNATYADADRIGHQDQLYMASDVSRLLQFKRTGGSQTTLLVGSLAQTHSHTTAVLPNNAPTYWGTVSGQTLVGSGVASGTIAYSFDGKTVAADAQTLTRRARYASPPTVVLNSSTTNEIFGVSRIQNDTFDWIKHNIVSASAATIYWHVHGPINIQQGSGSGLFELL